jgi:SAM-dependent methyltransferase
MLLGREQVHNPNYSTLEKTYIALFGMPVVGLRIRGRNIFSLIPKRKRYHKILDAGSGPGVFSFELGRRFPEAEVLGIDLLPDAISACKAIAEKTGSTNVDFKNVSIAQIADENSFDLIICVDILEHIEDDMAALGSLYNATAPGGTLLLHVPSLYRRYPVFKRRINFDVPTHVRPGYEVSEITGKVKETGFSIANSGLTYGFFETLANNISYLITGARMKNKLLYSIVFPLLNLVSLIGSCARPKNIGAGIFIIAEKIKG